MEAPQWDLDQIGVGGPDGIRASFKKMPVRATGFADSYRGKLGTLGPGELKELIEARDAMFIEFEGSWLYCRLAASAKTADQVAGALNNASTEAGTAVGQALAPLEIELGKRLISDPSVISSKGLTVYRHYLEKLAKAAPHLLSEKEELVILEKDKSGAIEWQQLQRSWLTTRTFPMKIDGKEVSLSFGQMYGNLRSPDRELRRQTTEVLGKALGENEIVWSHALRAICSDHLAMCKRRGYSSPEEASYVAHDVQGASIEALMGSIERNTALNNDWMTTKAKLMGLAKLSSYDIYAPLLSKAARRYTWDEARDIVTSAYSDFDEQMGEWVAEMFDGKRIDAEVRVGKYNGAFSDDWIKGKAAFILQSYNGAADDVNTLAHELGHAMHSHLYSRAQAPSNCRIAPCVAECASTFGELLLTEKMLKVASSEDERRVVIAKVLDGFDLSVFLTATRFRLESGLYKALGEGKYLDGATISDMWVAARTSIFHDAVDWPEETKWEWARVPHFYFPDIRYYNYPYAFAQLFTFALYRIYKEEGRDFVPRFKALLSAGSSKSAEELASDFGFDLSKGTFWQKGMDQDREFLKMIR